MKTKILSLVASLVLASSLLGQSLFGNATLSTTPATIITNTVSPAYAVDSIIINATTTNATTVCFYDSTGGSTNIINAAYSRYSSYATNVTSIFTNENGIIITNTYPGRYDYAIAVAAATNERPYLYKVIVPANSQLTKQVLWLPARGVTVVSSAAATLQYYYHSND